MPALRLRSSDPSGVRNNNSRRSSAVAGAHIPDCRGVQDVASSVMNFAVLRTRPGAPNSRRHRYASDAPLQDTNPVHQ